MRFIRPASLIVSTIIVYRLTESYSQGNHDPWNIVASVVWSLVGIVGYFNIALRK